MLDIIIGVLVAALCIIYTPLYGIGFAIALALLLEATGTIIAAVKFKQFSKPIVKAIEEQFKIVKYEGDKIGSLNEKSIFDTIVVFETAAKKYKRFKYIDYVDPKANFEKKLSSNSIQTSHNLIYEFVEDVEFDESFVEKEIEKVIRYAGSK